MLVLYVGFWVHYFLSVVQSVSIACHVFPLSKCAVFTLFYTRANFQCLLNIKNEVFKLSGVRKVYDSVCIKRKICQNNQCLEINTVCTKITAVRVF